MIKYIIGYFLIIIFVMLVRYYSIVEPYANFINFNLTNKPVANYEPYNVYKWWRNGEKFDQYKDCDQYRCIGQCKVSNYEIPRKKQKRVHFKDFDEGDNYYDNPSRFCLMYKDINKCSKYYV